MKQLIFEIVVLILLIVMIVFHSKRTIYICSNCKKEFKLKALKDLFSFNTLKGKYIKCPYCNVKANHLEKVEYYKKTKNKK